MLEKIIPDIIFGVSSYITDGGSTYFLCKKDKDGPDIETKLETRKGMKREGIGKGLFKESLRGATKMGLYGCLLFGLDNLLGLEDDILNFHHAFFYGFGGLKHYAALTHVLYTTGMKKLAISLQKPLFLLLEFPIFSSTYDMK